ncbi:hypothetical protein M433DRAFT_388393 [Acidomyces richmondensis BFW]|nr:hypothetical protein M433DRAFT_388393 [Acidomyces richmondensis BFW]
MICGSGLCASLINLSQFHIITNAGPVSSTVVGHVKTLLIVSLVWMLNGKNASCESLLGLTLALFGITRSVIIEAIAVSQQCTFTDS